MKIRFIPMMIATTLLWGCSSEPSHLEVRKSIEEAMNRDIANITERKILGLDLGTALGINRLKINEVEKIDCVNISKKIVTCEVLLDYEILTQPGGIADLLGGAQRVRKVNTYKFVKTTNGWNVVDGVAQ